MKKLFLASTALVSLAAVSATAQAADVSISGVYELKYQSVDKGGSGDQNSVVDTPEVDISYSDVTDSGISTSMTYSIDNQNVKFSVAGDFGTIAANTDGNAVADLDIDVDGATPEEADNVGADSGAYKGGFGGSGSDKGTPSVSYTLLTLVDGLTLAASVRNNTNNEEGLGYGLQYSGGFGDATIKLAAARATTNNGDANGNATPDSTEMHLGFSVGLGGVSLMVEQNSKEVDGSDTDYSSLGVGATYSAGAVTFGAFQRSAETDHGDMKDDFSFSAYSLAYTIAPGLKADLTTSSGELNDESADTLALTLKASF